ncbi:MAG TPA: isochorismatase family cysteine hydrolase [Burkholderiales bacterium]|nr:isochorismatase family cysteine hydrolase [Burkholderiales bacterium]
MSKTALLILDVQNEFVDPKGKVGANGFAKIIDERQIIPKIAKTQAAFRAKALPVAFVNVGYRADYADAISRSARLKHLIDMNAIVLGTWGTEFPEAIKPLPSEIVFTKRAVNPFYNTPLLSWLLRQGVDTVALTGCHTHMVVDSAARYADDAGLYVKVIEDCCASPDPELHRIEIEKILPLFATIISAEVLLQTL